MPSLPREAIKSEFFAKPPSRPVKGVFFRLAFRENRFDLQTMFAKFGERDILAGPLSASVF